MGRAIGHVGLPHGEIDHLSEHNNHVRGLPRHVLQRGNPVHTSGRILSQPANRIHPLAIQPSPFRNRPPPHDIPRHEHVNFINRSNNFVHDRVHRVHERVNCGHEHVNRLRKHVNHRHQPTILSSSLRVRRSSPKEWWTPIRHAHEKPMASENHFTLPPMGWRFGDRPSL